MVIIIAFLVGRYVFPLVTKGFGGVTNYDEVDATALKIGGANGSRLGPIIEGTCTLQVTAGNTTASSTTVADCPVTGVVSGDNVNIWFATSTNASPQFGAASPNWEIVGVKASTTSGYITGVFLNQTGTSANLGNSGIASTTFYRVSHPVSSVPGL